MAPVVVICILACIFAAAIVLAVRDIGNSSPPKAGPPARLDSIAPPSLPKAAPPVAIELVAAPEETKPPPPKAEPPAAVELVAAPGDRAAPEKQPAKLTFQISFQGADRDALVYDDSEFEEAFLRPRESYIDKHFYSKLVGVKFNNGDGVSRQRLIARCKRFDLLDLHREPDNPWDKNAIFAVSQSGAKLGYLNARVAEEISRDVTKHDRVWFGAIKAVHHETGDRAAGVVICLFRIAPEYVKAHPRKPSGADNRTS